jgi:hypothetical protein
MSAMPDSEFPVFTLDDLDTPINLVEGNWQLYRHRITCEETARAAIPHFGTLTAYQRTCAMNYLGKHGQIHGGVCSKGPSILSTQFIAKLNAFNETKRYGRYPWLETLLNLFEQIKDMQGQSDTVDNRFSFVIAQDEKETALKA